MKSWPFVGRQRELEAWADATASGPGANLVIACDRGVGKTRLAEEIAIRTEGRGWRVTRLNGRPNQWQRLGLFADLQPGPAADHDLEPERSLARHGRRVLDRITTGGGPSLVVVDNGHLVDEYSASIVFSLAQRLDVSVVVTVLAGHASPSAIQDLWTSGMALRLRLDPLTRDEVTTLVEQALGPTAGESLGELYRVSEGNPLFLQELVEGGREDGYLSVQDGVWHHHGSAGGVVRLQELMLGRLRRRNPAERRALELIALAGEIRVDRLRPLVDPDDLRRLRERGLVVTVTRPRGDKIKLVHPVYAEVLRDGMAVALPTRAGELFEVLIDDLDSAEPDDMIRLAQRLLDAEMNLLPDVLYRAARAAYRYFDLTAARRFVTAALLEDDRVEGGILLAEITGAEGDPERGLAMLDELAARASTDSAKAQIALAWATITYRRLANPLAAIGHLARLLPELEDRKWRGLVSIRLALDLMRSRGDIPSALDRIEANLGRFGVSAEERLTGHLARVIACSGVGRFADADRSLAMAREALAELADPDPLYADQLGLEAGLLLIVRGEPLAAEEHLRRGVDELGQRPTDVLGAWLALLGRALLRRGWASSAHDVLERAVAALALDDRLGFRRYANAGVAEAAALMGDAQSARRIIAAAGRAAGVGRSPMSGHAADRTLALAAGFIGDLGDARARLLGAADDSRERGRVYAGAFALFALGRLGLADDEARERFTALARDSEIWFAELAEILLGMTEASEAVLDRWAWRLRARGCDLLAAELAAVAATQCAAADPTLAFRHLRRVDEFMAREWLTAQTPLLRRAPELLSARETEIAILVGEGCTNDEIATRLILSPRSVATYTSSIYRKLGLAGKRDHLIAIMAREPWAEDDRPR